MGKWDFFKSGWRPLLGWLSLVIIFAAFIIHPAMIWTISLFGLKIIPPIIDSTAIMNIIALILGVGAMRTVEKLGGISNHHSPSGRYRSNKRPSYHSSDDEDEDEYGDEPSTPKRPTRPTLKD